MKSLLVVVDMQRDFVSGPLGTKEAQNILPAVVAVSRNSKGMWFIPETRITGIICRPRRGSSFRWSIACRGPQVGRLCQKCGTRGRERSVAVLDKPTFGLGGPL